MNYAERIIDIKAAAEKMGKPVYQEVKGQKDIDKALTILAAIKEAEKKGSGVIAVNGKMVDKPVVIRAQRTIDLAIASGVLKKEDVDNE